jgi:hypothetical protein
VNNEFRKAYYLVSCVFINRNKKNIKQISFQLFCKTDVSHCEETRRSIIALKKKSKQGNVWAYKG